MSARLSGDDLPRVGGMRTSLGVPIQVAREDLDKVAEFLLSLQGSALWSRMPELLKERWRDKARHIFILCGFDPTGQI